MIAEPRSWGAISPEAQPPIELVIGATRYRVRISDEPLANAAGEARTGLWEWARRVIWICPTVDPENRLEVVLHEARHAWLHHYGQPATVEDDCNSTAAFAMDIMGQLTRQGGAAALAQPQQDVR